MAEETRNTPEFKVRYSDEELQEFKAIILEMLEKAKKEYKTLRDVVTHGSSNDIEDTKNLVLDLKSLEYISSAGLRVLLSAQKKMQKSGSMKVTNVCEEVMEVFEMTGFADILTIE